MLGVIFATFVLLWSPFFIVNIMLAFCSRYDICPIQENYLAGSMDFVTWLGYISSTVNPFFYTFFNKTFREAFKGILKCRCRAVRQGDRPNFNIVKLSKM